MTKTVEFYYDFGSPNTYMANRVLPEILKRTQARVSYRPVLLGGIFKATNNQAPWMTFSKVQAKMNYMAMEMKRFAKKHGLDKYRLNPHFPLNTLLLMRGAIVAQDRGEIDRYIQVGERCVWEEGLKMDDPEVFIEAFTAAGFDGAALVQSTREPEVKQKLIAYTEDAVKKGLFGLPSFIVNDELFFGKDSLRDIEDELAA